MIEINIIIHLQVSKKLRQYLSSVETTLLVNKHIIFLEPFWNWSRNNFWSHRRWPSIAWCHFWINLLLDNDIILCDICRNVIPDKKNSPNSQIEMKLLILAANKRGVLSIPPITFSAFSRPFPKRSNITREIW